MIELLLDHLVAESLLTIFHKPGVACKFVQKIDYQTSFHTIHTKLTSIPSVRSLLQSPNPKFIGVPGQLQLVDCQCLFVSLNKNILGLFIACGGC